MAGGRSRTFRPHWALQYALAVAERDPETGQPTKAACLMCRVFTRDETEGSRRRKRKTKVQCFSQPWRPDNMRRHLEQQHKLRWAQYKELSDEDKRGFFPANAAISRQPHVDPVEITPETNAVLPVVELNAAVAAAVKKSGTFLVDKDIVDELLRPLGPDGDEFLGFEMQRIEIDSDDEDLELDVDENDARYVVTVESRLELETCITFMAGGVSFRQAAQLFRGMVGGIAGLDQTNRAMTEKRVKNLCRVACAVNLQRLKDLLESGKVWSFAVVLEWCKTAGSPFLDVRVQFEHEGEIHSVHLVGIVVQDVDFAEESGDLVVRYLDVVAPRWKAKLVGISCVDEDLRAT
ncbi:hypothetical protein PR003_g2648 [Phytophthora rubi]|uniref:Uncharacterized protein n=1 Tax=Phytophthora rubi TaxID=129364 RepID=A0A6A4G2X6_9STRA|nr:hypothetical protein PR003_g2648 [Phytophthora rubi]